MKISDTLYGSARDLWDQAAQKPFVKAMAEGTLDGGRFRHYMMQDYLYLLDYLRILELMKEYTDSPDLLKFISGTIAETENETYRVHVPHMRKIGVSDDDIRACAKEPVIAEYTEYMRGRLREKGLTAGLAALLQCSWVYAFIAERVTDDHAEELAESPYRFWFDAYTCREYLDANDKWIEVLNREASGISQEEAAELAAIFRKCAEYENRLWDALYETGEPV